MSADRTNRAFRDTLIPGDVDAARTLLERDPNLANTRPWEPEWSVTAIEAVAGMCVHHRPQAREIAALLLEHGAECGFQAAARAGLLDHVKAMLAADPTLLDAIDEEDRTALYRSACVYGKFDEGEAVADYLIAAGAEVDVYTACTFGDLARVEAHLEHDPTIAQSVDAEGLTPLHWAARVRRHREHAVAITVLLLDHGADVHAVNPTEEDMTAMHHVAEWCGDPGQVTLLLEHGADINATSKPGWTPLDYAVDRGRREMASFLEGLGARRSADG